MPIHFLCPFGHKLVVPDHRAGKKGRCPTCHQKVIVPVANPKPSGRPKKDWDANEEIAADAVGGQLGFDAPAVQPAQAAIAPAAQPAAQPAAPQAAPAAQPYGGQVPQALPTAQPFANVPTAAPAPAAQQIPFQEIPQAPAAQDPYGQQQQPWWPQQ